jgi:hypothetical protein
LFVGRPGRGARLKPSREQEDNVDMTRKAATLGLAGAVVAAALFSAKPSQAQEYYRKGEISVALERAFGILYAHDDVSGPRENWQRSVTSIGVGWSGAVSPFHYTRAAVDGFVTDRLSIGGSLAFYVHAGDADDSGVLLAPRVGYVFPISRVFSFWLRGGPSFVKLDNQSLFGLSVEGMFVASPQPNWGILFGPTLDLAFVGSRPDNTDWTEVALGFPSVGLMGTF